MFATASAAGRLKSVIEYSLQHELCSNAEFYAERLYALNAGDDESAFLLATTRVRQQQWLSAKLLLGGRQSVKCRMLFVRCCLELRHCVEAENVLKHLLSQVDHHVSELDLGLVHHLLGVTYKYRTCILGVCRPSCRLIGSRNLSCQHLLSALQYNPFLFEAVEALSEQGILSRCRFLKSQDLI
jgi:hypothetical protein